MDIVEFAERFCGAELKDWQKQHIRMLDRMRKDGRINIVMPKNASRSQVYIYMNQKELIPHGKTFDSK